MILLVLVFSNLSLDIAYELFRLSLLDEFNNPLLPKVANQRQGVIGRHPRKHSNPLNGALPINELVHAPRNGVGERFKANLARSIGDGRWTRLAIIYRLGGQTRIRLAGRTPLGICRKDQLP